jgi:serine/threonine-protein kinase
METIAMPGLHPGVAPGAPQQGEWGQLQLRQKVGQGGFGEVYRAWDPALEREVALKILYVGDLGLTGQKTSITTEARLLAKVRHQNVVTVHGVAEHKGCVGLWMEFIEGQTLDQLVRQQGRFGSTEAASIGMDVCRALAAVHNAGLIHGDIKAQNVMREDGGRIVLMDFGLGQPVRPDGPAVLAGTPLYMAPELLRGERATVKTDIYATGVLLFHLVTGTFPVEGSTSREVSAAHRNRRPRLLRDLRPDLPESYLQVVERALAPNPAERFETAGHMLQALAGVVTAAAGSSPITQPLPAPPAKRWRHRIAAAALAVAIGAGALGIWYSRQKLTEHPSIAVLPFENLSADSENEYFSDGIADELIHTLSSVPELRVMARASAFQFKGKGVDVRAVAEKLHVRSVLTGSVRKQGNLIRVVVQLTDASTGYLLWSDVFERELSSVFAVQDEIARSVSRSLQVKLAGAAAVRAEDRNTSVPEVYTLYLKGRYHAAKHSRADMDAAVASFEQALAKDPSYARAWAALAETYAFMGMRTGAQDAELVRKAKAVAAKALALDNTLAEAHTSQGLIEILYDWDVRRAEASFRSAIRQNPGYASARYIYAGLLLNQGRFQEADSEVRVALQLDPLSGIVNYQLALLLFVRREYQAALDQIRKTREVDPQIILPNMLSVWVHIQRGRHEEALAAARKIRALRGEDAMALALLAQALASAGRHSEARQALHTLLAKQDGQPAPPIHVALAYLALGDRERALDWLERGCAERQPLTLQMPVLPQLDPLRAEPRFQALVRRMG